MNLSRLSISDLMKWGQRAEAAKNTTDQPKIMLTIDGAPPRQSFHIKYWIAVLAFLISLPLGNSGRNVHKLKQVPSQIQTFNCSVAYFQFIELFFAGNARCKIWQRRYEHSPAKCRPLFVLPCNFSIEVAAAKSTNLLFAIGKLIASQPLVRTSLLFWRFSWNADTFIYAIFLRILTSLRCKQIALSFKNTLSISLNKNND